MDEESEPPHGLAPAGGLRVADSEGEHSFAPEDDRLASTIADTLAGRFTDLGWLVVAFNGRVF